MSHWDLIRERAAAGLVAARRLYAEGKTSIGTICATFGISKSTFYRYVARDAAGPAGGTG